MVKYKILSALLALVLLTSCTTRTPHGVCVGLADTKDANKVYEYSYWNIFLGLVFSETFIVPLVVIGKELECPVSNKND